MDAMAMPLITILPGASAAQLRAETLDKVPAVSAMNASTAVGRLALDSRLARMGGHRPSSDCPLVELTHFVAGAVNGDAAPAAPGRSSVERCTAAADPSGTATAVPGAAHAGSSAAAVLRHQSPSACARGSAAEPGNRCSAASNSTEARQGETQAPSGSVSTCGGSGHAARMATAGANDAQVEAVAKAALVGQGGMRVEGNGRGHSAASSATADGQRWQLDAVACGNRAERVSQPPPSGGAQGDRFEGGRCSGSALSKPAEHTALASAEMVTTRQSSSDSRDIDKQAAHMVHKSAVHSAHAAEQLRARDQQANDRAMGDGTRDEEYVPWYLW